MRKIETPVIVLAIFLIGALGIGIYTGIESGLIHFGNRTTTTTTVIPTTVFTLSTSIPSTSTTRTTSSSSSSTTTALENSPDNPYETNWLIMPWQGEGWYNLTNLDCDNQTIVPNLPWADMRYAPVFYIPNQTLITWYNNCV
jgi:hypothetical protein